MQADEKPSEEMFNLESRPVSKVMQRANKSNGFTSHFPPNLPKLPIYTIPRQSLDKRHDLNQRQSESPQPPNVGSQIGDLQQNDGSENHRFVLKKLSLDIGKHQMCDESPDKSQSIDLLEGGEQEDSDENNSPF